MPKKGLEPPHPCGYMDLNHARLPIPPLRQVTTSVQRQRAALMEETATSILQGRDTLSNHSEILVEKPIVTASKKNSAAAAHAHKKRAKQDDVAQLRALAHDLSNALEAILQASYLLGQSKLDETSRRWAQLIGSSSEQAARINRDMRKLLREIGGE